MHDPQPPAAPLGGGPHERGDPLDLTQAAAPLRAQHVTGFGQRDTRGAAVEQDGAELAFEHPDLLGKPRLGDMETFRGAAEVQFLGDHGEVLQPPQIHPGMITVSSQACS